MKPGSFAEPVTILTGIGFPTKVGSVMDAYRLLTDWPEARRDGAYLIALKSCKAALSGVIEAETARGLFVAFAEKQDLLAPDVDLLVAARGRRGGAPHLR